MEPLIITLKTATVATVITFFAGIFLAHAVSKLKHGKTFADALIMLPMVLPPTVVGFFLLLIFGKRGVFGKFFLQFDVTFVFTWKAALIAAVIVSLPLMYRTTRGAFEQLDENIIYAAVQANDYDLAFKWAILLALLSLTFIFAMNAWIRHR